MKSMTLFSGAGGGKGERGRDDGSADHVELSPGREGHPPDPRCVARAGPAKNARRVEDVSPERRQWSLKRPDQADLQAR
jgi:hypothetical protein